MLLNMQLIKGFIVPSSTSAGYAICAVQPCFWRGPDGSAFPDLRALPAERPLAALALRRAGLAAGLALPAREGLRMRSMAAVTAPIGAIPSTLRSCPRPA